MFVPYGIKGAIFCRRASFGNYSHFILPERNSWKWLWATRIPYIWKGLSEANIQETAGKLQIIKNSLKAQTFFTGSIRRVFMGRRSLPIWRSQWTLPWQRIPTIKFPFVLLEQAANTYTPVSYTHLGDYSTLKRHAVPLYLGIGIYQLPVVF